ncbi:hypothetical protein EGI26_10530 [Lacihabitans sp. CCS-44]|nr:hypothetical protein [Lacihabitans sp. CCS-44]
MNSILKKEIMEQVTNIFENPKNQSSLGIKDCLKLIGIKEITANIYAVPKGKKNKSELLTA